jgi:hypothetical protein
MNMDENCQPILDRDKKRAHAPVTTQQQPAASPESALQYIKQQPDV